MMSDKGVNYSSDLLSINKGLFIYLLFWNLDLMHSNFWHNHETNHFYSYIPKVFKNFFLSFE